MGGRPAVCTAWNRGGCSGASRSAASSKARTHELARAPPPTWIDQAVERPAFASELGDELVAEGLAALDREAVVRTLARERHGAVVDGSAERVVGRVARNAFGALADLDGRA